MASRDERGWPIMENAGIRQAPPEKLWEKILRYFLLQPVEEFADGSRVSGRAFVCELLPLQG
jgi:hypothetical protein